MNDGIRNENLICTQNSYFILIKLYNWLRTALIISKCSTWPINTIHKWLLLNSYDCILHSLKHSSVNFVFIRTHPKQPFFTFPATPTLWSSGGGRSPTDLENYDVRCVKKKKTCAYDKPSVPACYFEQLCSQACTNYFPDCWRPAVSLGIMSHKHGFLFITSGSGVISASCCTRPGPVYRWKCHNTYLAHTARDLPLQVCLCYPFSISLLFSSLVH